MSKWLGDIAKEIVETVLQEAGSVTEVYNELKEIKFEGIKITIIDVAGDGKNLKKSMSAVAVVIGPAVGDWYVSLSAFIPNGRKDI